MAILRVDPVTGDDGNSYAAVAGGAAWQTLNHARTQALKGDRIRVYDNGGVYLYTAPATGDRDGPAFQLTNGGDATTEAERITVQAAGDFQVRLGTTGGDGPVIGSNARSFTTWEGFYLDENDYVYHSDTGPIVVFGGSDNYLERITVQGRSVTGSLDNHNAVRWENTVRPRMRNCLILDIYQASWGDWATNSAGCMMYGVTDFLVEHNDFMRCGTGLFPKGTAAGGSLFNYGVARYNQFRQCAKSMRTTFLHASSLTEFYQNLIWDEHPDPQEANQRFGFQINEWSRNLHVYNNTFVKRYGPASSVATGHSNIRWFNNIIVGTGAHRVVNLLEIGTPWEFDFNLYNDTTGFSFNGVNHPTIEAWRLALGGAGDWNDNNSFIADPLFESATDFRLQAGSPAAGAGIGGVALGCYITGEEIMGVLPLDFTPPPVPLGLRLSRFGKLWIAYEG